MGGVGNKLFLSVKGQLYWFCNPLREENNRYQNNHHPGKSDPQTYSPKLHGHFPFRSIVKEIDRDTFFRRNIQIETAGDSALAFRFFQNSISQSKQSLFRQVWIVVCGNISDLAGAVIKDRKNPHIVKPVIWPASCRKWRNFIRSRFFFSGAVAST